MNIDLIKASAGSGKTYTLMGLLSKSIASGVRPEELLATTFTVKAAAELQSRIRQELLGGAQPELASQVFDGLIGTINGVCGQLLSEYAVESGLSPALDVLPEDNAEMVFAAATHAVFEQYAEKLERVASVLEFNPLKENHYRKSLDWRNDVRNIVDLARSNRIDKEGLNRCAERACSALKEIFTAEKKLSLQDIAAYVAPYRNYDAKGTDTIKAVNAINSFLRFPTWGGAVSLANSKYNKTIDVDFPIDILNAIGYDLLSSTGLYEDMTAMIRGVFACAGDALAAYAQYKKDLGLIDFVDQESNVLDLLENNENFRSLMSSRINQMMVDEFQDTSPIQLALFLKFNKCSQKGSVWVGDPKQAIYGFRGTDPELMEAVAATVSDYRTLEYSWRSRENLVNLSNAIFKKAFSDMPENDVCLKIPAERKQEAVGGEISAWHLCGNADVRMAEMAGGIASLIRDKGYSPSDICVLFKTNTECSALANALAKWNISASAPAGMLLEHIECQLVMAAYRYCIDHSDTAALAVLTALCGKESDWLNKFCQAKNHHLSLSDEEQKASDPFARLKDARWLMNLEKPADAAPLEILEYVIAELELDRIISSMSNPDLRLSNLNELRKVCNEYTAQALVNRTAATPAGFIAMLEESEKSSSKGFGKNTVNVMTYHKSKGLEFPVVILGSLNAGDNSGAFGIRVQQAETFDVDDPLKDRSIHYWPWPFGASKNISGLAAALSSNAIQQHAVMRDNEERKRVFYVGLTRAKDHVIFAMERNTKTDTLMIKRLDDLTDTTVFDFPMEQGSGVLKIGSEKFEINTQIFSGSPEIIPLSSPPLYGEPTVVCDFVPAKRNPSAEEAVGKAVLLAEWEHLTTNIRCEKNKYSSLGSAFHDYIALNPQKNGVFYAERLLENYGVENAITPEIMTECCRNLYCWVESTYPEAKISCELPITYHDENGTLYQGFIDMLLELPEGYVIIDHKTHPAQHDAEQYAAGCAGQLNLYRKAVEMATGRKVLRTIIHLPNIGRCYDVK